MQSQDRQIRVFISSTFPAMHAERDHLETVVFPELKERFEQLGLEFFDVDLCWMFHKSEVFAKLSMRVAPLMTGAFAATTLIDQVYRPRSLDERRP
jgi:hypothetical protein